jgi:hypothetical protein
MTNQNQYLQSMQSIAMEMESQLSAREREIELRSNGGNEDKT